MIDKRPQADRLLVAEIWGEARRWARWRELGDTEEAAAVAALRELAGGRADLLAEVAGILEGAREGEPDEPLARQAADAPRARPGPTQRRSWPGRLKGGAGGHRHGGRRSRADCDRRKGRRAPDGAPAARFRVHHHAGSGCKNRAVG